MAQRPPNVKPPAYLSPSKPVLQPEAAPAPPDPLDPTRYGDWERKGRGGGFLVPGATRWIVLN